MMHRFKLFLPVFLIVISILACASPQELLPRQQVDQAATIVAGTLSALTPSAPACDTASWPPVRVGSRAAALREILIARQAQRAHISLWVAGR